ncbi:MAG: hypothetical protein H7123_06650, partial [Thermoleophilia bacterium]|nr:hypothetical protein [Thermoleophilia bacterium]
MNRVVFALLLAVSTAYLAFPAAASAAWDSAGTTIAPGVSIGGVDVSNLTKADAIVAVRAAYGDTPVTFSLYSTSFQRTPEQLGQTLALAPAIVDAYGVRRDATGTPPPAT